MAAEVCSAIGSRDQTRCAQWLSRHWWALVCNAQPGFYEVGLFTALCVGFTKDPRGGSAEGQVDPRYPTHSFCSHKCRFLRNSKHRVCFYKLEAEEIKPLSPAPGVFPSEEKVLK